MGGTVGGEEGGILNREAGQCPDQLSRDWEYYNDMFNSWEEDWTMEAECLGGPTRELVVTSIY